MTDNIKRCAEFAVALLTALSGSLALAQTWPSKPISQAVTDTIAGQAQVLMNGMLATLPFVQSGKLKVLGVSKATRVPLLANVPTIAEQGVAGFESGTWQGILAPASMPPATLNKLSAELTRIIRSPEVRERLVAQGAEVHTMN